MQVQFLSWGDLLEESMATHFSILDGRIPGIEEPGVLYGPWGHKELDMTEATQQQQIQLLGYGTNDRISKTKKLPIKFCLWDSTEATHMVL